MLAVMRFDDASTGKPIAVVVNFAAHPMMTNERILKYSADYPGFMKKKVESQLRHALRLHAGGRGRHERQRANTTARRSSARMLGDLVIQLARIGQDPGSAASLDQRQSRPFSVPLADRFLESPGDRARTPAQFVSPSWSATFRGASFKDGVPVELNTILLNGDMALVGGVGRVLLRTTRIGSRSARTCRMTLVLRLLQRPQHVLPHDRGRLRRGLRSRRASLARGSRRRRTSDEPGPRQPVHDARQAPPLGRCAGDGTCADGVDLPAVGVCASAGS